MNIIMNKNILQSRSVSSMFQRYFVTYLNLVRLKLSFGGHEQFNLICSLQWMKKNELISLHDLEIINNL